ncbi:hypothetical protein GCM10020366_20190 [Saccharopolyspora gregorii]|uniref:Cytochrome P450 n=1 Tax=Saccharopolyspora gregorii TaxID=33914 RepID=A0ABP6RNC8_9PSEU
MRADDTTCPVTGHATDPLPFPFPLPTALEPPPEWRRLQQECPVARVRTVIGEDALLLTRYEDVRAILADPRFTRRPLDGAEDGSFPNTIAQGEGHLRWRRLLSRSFTVKRMRALQPRIAGIAHELIDEMLRQGAPADLRTALGFPLPVYVICELLGVPAADRAKFAHWSDHMLNLTRYTEDEVRASGRSCGTTWPSTSAPSAPNPATTCSPSSPRSATPTTAGSPRPSSSPPAKPCSSPGTRPPPT